MIPIEIKRASDELIEASAARMQRIIDKGTVKESDYTTCYICGRYLHIKTAVWLHVIDGGSSVREGKEPYNERADLGAQAVGRDCLSRQPALLALAKKTADF